MEEYFGFDKGMEIVGQWEYRAQGLLIVFTKSDVIVGLHSENMNLYALCSS